MNLHQHSHWLGLRPVEEQLTLRKYESSRRWLGQSNHYKTWIIQTVTNCHHNIRQLHVITTSPLHPGVVSLVNHQLKSVFWVDPRVDCGANPWTGTRLAWCAGTGASCCDVLQRECINWLHTWHCQLSSVVGRCWCLTGDAWPGCGLVSSLLTSPHLSSWLSRR